MLAIYDFEAGNPDELSFHQGNIITVLENSSSDWWQGELNGVIGYFPMAYVEPLSSSHSIETETGKDELNTIQF